MSQSHQKKKNIVSKQFLILDAEEIEEGTKKSENENTKAEKRADKAFYKFLVALGYKEDEPEY